MVAFPQGTFAKCKCSEAAYCDDEDEDIDYQEDDEDIEDDIDYQEGEDIDKEENDDQYDDDQGDDDQGDDDEDDNLDDHHVIFFGHTFKKSCFIILTMFYLWF